MDVLMLEGWTPILLTGVVAAIIIFSISRKTSRNFLLLMSAMLSLICFGVLIYSIIGIGGWDGMGLGFITITIFLGIWIGTAFGVIIKKKSI